MTGDRMALIELIEKGADSDLVRELLAFAADRMMELEVEARTKRTQPIRWGHCYRTRSRTQTEPAVELKLPA